MKVMIFGGAGFIGSHLSNFFLNAGHEVVLVDNLITGVLPESRKNLEFYQFDINTQFSDWETLPQDIDIIYHLAFPTSLCNRDYSSQFTDCCTVGMYNIMTFCNRTCGKIIYGSSISVYGEAKRFPITEENEINPILYYGAHKFLNEQYLNIFQHQGNISFEIIRIGDVFGERDMRNNAVNNFIRGISKGLTITVNGNGNQIRTYTYVRDAAMALCRLSEKPLTNGIYNLVGSNHISVMELITQISQALECNPCIQFNDSEHDKRDYFFDNKKLISRIGTFEKIGFKQGLMNTINSIIES